MNTYSVRDVKYSHRVSNAYYARMNACIYFNLGTKNCDTLVFNLQHILLNILTYVRHIFTP